MNSHFNDSNYSEAAIILDELSNIAYKEFNAIYSNSFILNYVINNNLNKIIEHNIDIKTVIEYSNFENLDYTTQLHLFEYILKISIDSCIQTNTLNKIIIIKSIKSADRVVLKILYSGVISNKKSIISNFEKILLNAYYKLSIKQIDENFISILITFN